MPAVTLEATLKALSAAEAIPGWMSRLELVWLIEQARGRGTVVEVGSYRGRSTKALAMSADGTVWSVDNLHGESDPPPQEPSVTTGEELDGLFRDFLADELASGRVEIVREPSPAAAALFEDGSVDMIFIDGDHRYPAPKLDVQAWAPKLAPGGLLCGHDSPDAGVARSLAELGIHQRGPDRIWHL